MGLMTDAPEGTDNGAADELPENGEQQAPIQEAAPKPSEPVPLPAKPTGRRAQEAAAREQTAKEIEALRTSQAERDKEWQRRFDEQNSNFQRFMAETVGRIAQPQQQQAQQPQGPTPEQLMTEATAALDRGDHGTYQAKLVQAAKLEALRDMRAEMAKAQPQQQQQAPTLDPQLQMVIMTTPAAQKVVGHRTGMQMAALADQELALTGLQAGPERYRKAFELAEQRLFGGQQESAFSAGNRGALGGTPTGRTNGAAKGTPTITPPPGNWQATARMAGMTNDEYLQLWAEAHPEMVNS